jgi:hypothetical protein
VKCRREVRLLVQQMRPEHIRKEVVVAIPSPVVIQRDDEQVRSLERLQRLLRGVLARDSVTQRSAETLQNRRLEEKAANGFGLALQNLFDQLVHDEAVVPPKAGDESGDIVSPLHRQRG